MADTWAETIANVPPKDRAAFERAVLYQRLAKEQELLVNEKPEIVAAAAKALSDEGAKIGVSPTPANG